MPSFKFPKEKEINICVIGDMMLDHYINGSCDRISPEAPVQVVDIRNETYSLGGAGNVLKNLQAFGCQGSVIGICGSDDAGLIMEQQLLSASPSFYCLVKDDSRRTTLKSRVIVSRHQLIRLDKEDKHYCTDDIARQVINLFKEKATEIDVLIISDYCKGVLSPYLVNEVLSICRANNIISIVDSKHKNLSKYHGATVIKPNKKEAALASGVQITDEASLEQACKRIAHVTGCDTVVVTLSEDGMAIYHHNVLTTIPTKAIEVFDVTGAGDTVIAALGFALANKLTIQEACNFANHAAAVVVAKFGSATATLKEINNLN